MAILVLNAGSSNIKASIFQTEKNGQIAQSDPIWSTKVNWQKSDLDDCQRQIQDLLKSLPCKVDVVAHRIVHGGNKHDKSCLIDKNVLKDLQELIELAPLHEPVSIIAIECVSEILGELKQIAVFDTAFHKSMKLSAQVYPLPIEWFEKLNIHRFGFHGLSYKYVSKRLSEIEKIDPAKLNAIICHLGNGASLCAVKNGLSAFTTMGFTPLDGIMMGTRAGSIDPGIILYLLKHEKFSVEQLQEILNENSGLKGICGKSSMQEVEKLASSGDKLANLAIEIYIEKLASAIASLFTYFDFVPPIIFTGGIGENSAFVREQVCRKLTFAGIVLDLDLNNTQKTDSEISSKRSSAKILVIQSKEDLAIAEESAGF